MKKVRTAIFGTALVASIAFLPQAAFPQSTNTPSSSGETNTPSKSGQSKKAQLGFRDSTYLRRAAEASLFDAKVADLAAQKGGTSELKNLGHSLAQTHNQGYQELTRIAQTKGVSIPTQLNSRQQRTYDHLASMSGPDLDKAVLRHLVHSEESALRATETQSKKGTDPDLKQFAENAVPKLKSNLDQTRTLYAGERKTTKESAGAQNQPQSGQNQPPTTPENQPQSK